MQRKLITTAALLCAVLSATVAMGDVLRYGTAESPTAGGTVQLSAGTTATGVEAYVAEGAELILTNGDLTVSAPVADVLPEVAVHGGGVRIASALTAPDGLLVRSDSEMLVQTDFYPQAYNHSPTATLFAAGANLDEYIPVGGKISLRSPDKAAPLDGVPCCLKRSPGELTFEMQANDGFLRSVKVRLFQVGDDIYAQVLWARYAQYGISSIKWQGFSLESFFAAEAPVHSRTHVPTGWTMWYGLHTLALLRQTGSAHQTAISGSLSVSGRLSLEDADVWLEGDGAVAALSSSVPVSLSNSTLRVSSDTEATLRSPLSVANSEFSLGGNDDVEVTTGAIVKIHNNAQTTLFYDTQVSDIEITDASFVTNPSETTGRTIVKPDCWFGFYENDGSEITFQVQGIDGYNKCSIVRIWQEGSNVVGKVVRCPYNSKGKAPLGTDMRIPENVLGTGDYAVTNVMYNITRKKSVLRLEGEAFAGSGANVVVESNALVRVESRLALPEPSQGVVTVERGGEMRWYAPRVWETPVLPGFCVRGKLVYHTVGYNKKSVYDIDGGTVELRCYEGNVPNESGAYLNLLTFRDGASLAGYRPRIGDATECMWKVEGASPSWWTAGGLLVGNGTASSEGSRSFSVEVADVTGDGEADFISLPAKLSGYDDSLFTDLSSSYMRLKIVKTGAGTWEWRAKGGAWTGRLVLKDGVVRFTKNDSLDAGGLGLQFDGGELQLAAGTTNSVPKLVVSANSTLSLGEGSVIEFPDGVESFAAGTTISNGVTFAVSGPDVPVGRRMGVRFGTSACLSDNVLRQIKYNDMRVMQDSEGWLKPYVAGLIIICR